MKNIDWSKAPEGTTHFGRHLWYRLDKGVWFFHVGSAPYPGWGWIPASNSEDWFKENVIARPFRAEAEARQQREMDIAYDLISGGFTEQQSNTLARVLMEVVR